MHRVLFAVLLATTAATPALSSTQADDPAPAVDSQRDEGGRERAERRSEGLRAMAREDRVAPRDFRRSVRVRATNRSEGGGQRVQHSTEGHRDSHDPTPSHGDYHRDARQDHRDFHATNPSRREHRRYHREVNREHRRDHRSWDWSSRGGEHGHYHRDIREEHRDLHQSNPTRREHREWHRQVNRDHARQHRRWSTNWRTNSYYDWFGYRSRNGWLYRMPGYFDPYGYGYRRFQIGFSIGPSYYGHSNWLDAYRYRLPPAYGPYRWIRYYRDAVLVDIYTGQVVDVVYNVFW